MKRLVVACLIMLMSAGFAWSASTQDALKMAEQTSSQMLEALNRAITAGTTSDLWLGGKHLIAAF